MYAILISLDKYFETRNEELRPLLEGMKIILIRCKWHFQYI